MNKLLIELKELSTRQAVSYFLIRENLLKKTCNFRAEMCDVRQEDGTNVIQTLTDPTNEFEYESCAMTYIIKRFEGVVAARQHDRDACVYEEHFIETENVETCMRMIKRAIDEKSHETESRFGTYSWDARSEIWKRDGLVGYRSLNSVILQEKVKSKLLEDLEDFTSKDTLEWYRKHGIPFKRGYLFYGPPGTGKTSTINAISSFLKRRVYKLSLVAPGLCDNGLMSAIQSMKPHGILVMEDVDSLFGVHREKQEQFSTTFSGLLNAIDGLGDPKGHIFIMTSNHPEQLDSALKRKGRIDMELKFGVCTKDQAYNMFLKFYPGKEDDANEFIKKLCGEYTPAELESHFVKHRRKCSEEAIDIKKEDTSAVRSEHSFYT